MSSLSSKSAQEISDLLDEYGIKHGPVVDSTRSLYEKKLKEAMSKGKKAKQSPDKTYYREEEEEVTYVYRTPVRSDGAGDSGSYTRSRPTWNEREYEHEQSYSNYSRPKPEYRGRDYAEEPYMYDTPSTYSRNSTLKSTPMKSGQDTATAPKSSRLISKKSMYKVKSASCYNRKKTDVGEASRGKKVKGSLLSWRDREI